MKSPLLYLCIVFLFGVSSLPLAAAEGRTPGRVSFQENDDAAKVKSTYDKTKDETTVEFRQLPLKGNDAQRVFLSVSASYKGQKPKQPEDVILIISVLSSDGYHYPDIMAMQVLVDGQKVSETPMLNLDKRRADNDYLETIGTRMKYSLFQKLLKSASAELRLANLNPPLEATHVAKLRELDALLH